MKSGNKKQINNLKGYSGALLAKNAEIQNVVASIESGGMVYNLDTKELKVALGNSTGKDLKDHMHPYTHAALNHQHIFGLNEAWHVGNPRLWYTDDLVNHTDLCPLDGREIPIDAADKLAEVYPGTKLLTTPLKLLSGDGFTNGEITLKASSYKGDYLPARLCGEAVDISNFAVMTDQWLTDSTYNTSGQSITIKIDGDYSYRPDSYWIMPAAGTATEVLKHRPTPNSWKLEGSNDGSSWEIIDEVTDVTDMQPCTIYPYQCETLNDYFYFRLTITKWNEGADPNLEVGLRRFWIFGRRPDTFCLPDIPSPHPDFTWVVPYKELNVSMKNEDIGDIGLTSLQPSLLPPYRMETDGRILSRELYPDLFKAIGWKYDDREYTNFTLEMPDENTYIIASDDPVAVGGYTFSGFNEPDPSEHQYPLAWSLFGRNSDDEEWESILTVVDNLDLLPTYLVDTNVTEKEYTQFKFEVIEWAGLGEKTQEVMLQVHPVGYFYLPDIKTDAGTTYIVSQHTAHDVSSDIIQRLQADILKLAQSHASLQRQLQALLPDIEKE